jgi:hypothetical protein
MFVQRSLFYVNDLFCVIYCFSGSDIGVRQGGDLANGTSQFTPFFIGFTGK